MAVGCQLPRRAQDRQQEPRAALCPVAVPGFSPVGACQKTSCLAFGDHQEPASRGQGGVSGRQSTRSITLPGFDEDRDRVLRVEAIGDSPGKHFAGKVVEHGRNIGARPVEEPDFGRIDVPVVVWSDGPDSDPGFLGVDSSPRPSQSVTTNDSVPRCGRGKDLTEPLGEQRKAMCGS